MSIFYREKVVEIRPRETYEATFTEVQAPNYFYINNMTGTRLFAGCTFLPSEKLFEVDIPAHGQKVYGRAVSSAKFNIFNASATETARVILLAFYKEFDPAVLAATSTAQVDFTGMPVDRTTVVTGFEAQLPAGGNKIGSVDVANINLLTTPLANILARLKSVGEQDADIALLLNAITDHADIVSAINALSFTSEWSRADITSLMELLENGLTVSGGGSTTEPSAETMAQLVYLGKLLRMVAGETVKPSPVSYQGTDAKTIAAGVVLMITNDGENAITLTWGEQTFSLLAGESMTEFDVPDGLSITPNGNSYRLLYREETAQVLPNVPEVVTLENPAAAADIVQGKQALNDSLEVITGTHIEAVETVEPVESNVDGTLKMRDE